MFKYFRLISYLSTLCFLSSCEPVYRADIVNTTSKALLLELKFDQTTLETHWNGMPYIEFLKSYPNGLGIHTIRFDSSELKNYYMIPPGATFPLESGVGTEPTFELFKCLRIIGKDTIELKGRSAIEEAFLKTDKRRWELHIVSDNPEYSL